ncbi:L,D-transpeptidase family protein [Maricaulis sp.]|uniref:L,D-transpeptidase family protein n=1 Tax=Maricaulis sp. TaxID=1486257 RepID=UPI003A8F805E
MNGFGEGPVVLRVLGFLILFWLGAAGRLEAGNDDAQDVVTAPAPSGVSTGVRTQAGWTDAAVEQLAISLFDAPGHGLPSLDSTAEILLDPSLPRERRAALATEAFFRFGGWLRFGLTDAQTHALNVLDEAERAELGAVLNRALTEGRVGDALGALAPDLGGYQILRAEMLRLMALRPIWPGIDPGPSLALGDQGPRVDQLRARLAAVGLYRQSWQAGDVFDLRLETAVRRYQGRANLSPTGQMDQPTLRHLNITPQQRLAQLRVNLEQRRWQSRQPGERHIRVNLADFALEAWEGRQVARRHQVMVGRQVSSTPEFSEDMQYIVLNPWWGIPGGLARTRFQSFRRNPGLAAQRGFRIYDAGGNQISVYEIDWSRWGRDWPYRMSQPPGSTNPMGEVKFIFPNSHNVYIHDTTERDRFSETRRDFSAACVRVRDPLVLAEWVLSRQEGWDGDEIERVAAGNTPTVIWLEDRIPVHINYWTVVGDADGDVRYLNDLYHRDAAVIRQFELAWAQAAGPAGERFAGQSGAAASLQ